MNPQSQIRNPESAIPHPKSAIAKRLWEMGAGVALVLALAGAGGIWLHRWNLNRALTQAVYHSQAAEVRALLDRGADPNLRDQYGSRMVNCAARSSGATLKVLLQGGADPNVTERDGTRPIVYAAAAGYLDVVQILIRFGADVNAADPDGRTALIAAAGAHPGGAADPRIVKELLRARARTDLKNGAGETALRCARQSLARIERQALLATTETAASSREVARQLEQQRRHRKRGREIVRLLEAAGAKEQPGAP